MLVEVKQDIKNPIKDKEEMARKKKMKNPCWKGFVAYGMKKVKAESLFLTVFLKRSNGNKKDYEG